MVSNLPKSPRLFRCQFIAGSVPPKSAVLNQQLRFGDFYIHAHPDLAISRHSTDEIEILCLGHPLDPDNPSLDGVGILRSVAAIAKTFDALEQRTASLGGRWLLFVKINGELRLYPDAMGLKPAYYMNSRDTGDLWIASQPLLLSRELGLAIDRDTAERFLSAKFQNAWPGGVTPYLSVEQLLANHYLDLTAGTIHRFWPRQAIAPRDTEAAVAAISSTLHGLMQSAGARRSLALALSGGYDSRVLLACSGELRKDMETFTTYSPLTEYYDREIPGKLAKRMGLSHRLLKVQPPTEGFWELYKTNTAHMYSDPSTPDIYTWSAISRDKFILTGHGTEIIKCYYFPSGQHPRHIDGRELARISGYEGNPVGIECFSNWLKAAPSTGIDVVDLFCWEHRIGNWGALNETGFDTVCDVIPVFNCRRLLETALGVDARERCAPSYLLFRRLCKHAAPVTASLPFRWTLRDTVSDLVRKRISWKLWRLVHEAQMKRAGFAGWTQEIAKGGAMQEILQSSVESDRA